MSLLLFWGGNIPFDMVIWNGVNQMNIHFSKHPFRQVAFILFILFFNIILVEIILCSYMN